MSEYPKMIYRPYEANAPSDAVKVGEFACQSVIVHDEDQELIAAKEGYVSASEVIEPKPKRGRPRKEANE